jgi:dethiobiotin synthase
VARGLFVTGTDTGVGKTVVSAAVMRRYRAHAPLRYWKPIQTGIEQDDDTAEVRRLADCEADEIRPDGIRLPRPLSPHLSARLAGTRIVLDTLGRDLDAAHRWVVEGAGGVLVPLNEQALMVDLMAQLALPVLVVARATLGTINHSLLTVGTLRAHGLAVAGVVLVGEPNAENRQAIEHYGHVPVVGELPHFQPLTPERLADWAAGQLDPDQRLAEVFA